MGFIKKYEYMEQQMVTIFVSVYNIGEYLERFFEKEFSYLLDKVKEDCLEKNFKDFADQQNCDNFENNE